MPWHAKPVVNEMKRRSDLETLMVLVLKEKKRALSLSEIAPEISKIDKAIFSGKTPAKSLYSVIYRREKKRIELGLAPLFKKEVCRRDVLFSLNLQDEVV